MKNLIRAVRISLKNENWHSALFIALALPDICGKLENSSVTSKERYIKWFNKYLGEKYVRRNHSNEKNLVFLSGEDCYALRCSYFHEGTDQIDNQKCKKMLDKFIFGAKIKSHCNTIIINNKLALQLNVEIFCEDICKAVEKWLNDGEHKNKIRNRDHILKVHEGIIHIGTNSMI